MGVPRPLSNDLLVFLLQNIDENATKEPPGLEHLCLSNIL